jgi:double zinc ribbon protein
MKCPSCGHENREGAKFCNECAAPLPMPCPACGAPNPVAAKFCNECAAPVTGGARPAPQAFTSPTQTPLSYSPLHLAEKILTSRSALEGERKQVTVVFADVKGSMDLAEQVDPEEWHKIMDRFFALLSRILHTEELEDRCQ